MVTQERAKAYFAEKKLNILWVIGAFVAGALLLFSLKDEWSWWTLIIGCIFILVGFILKLMRNDYPSDAEIDASFIKLKEAKADLSLEKLGISKEDIVREPLKVLGVTSMKK